MAGDIADWLERLGLSKYADVFAESEIGLDILPDLSDADLKDLGVPLGDRKRLLKAAAVVEPLEAASYPLGVRSEIEVRTRTSKLQVGDSIFMYSDGLVDGRAHLPSQT